jgi:hypothetical protein
MAGMSAHAAATGVLKGVVVSADTDEPVQGVMVTLTSGTSGAEPETETVITDSEGRYRFEDLPTGSEHIYALDARYQGGLFAGRALTIPADTTEQPVIDTTLRVWPTTTDPDVIVVARNDLFVVQNDRGEAGVIEAFQLTNTGDRAYIGRGGGDENRGTPSLGFALPAAAQQESIQIVDSSLDLPELVRTDFGFGITAAIPPGRFTITFSYAVPGTAASYDLSRRALYPTLGFTIFAAESLDISSIRLTEKGPVEIDGKEYREYSTDEELGAGDSLQVIALADAGTPPGLIAGMVGVIVLVIVLGAIPILRLRRHKPDRPPEATREELLEEIARLDLEHQRDAIGGQEWARQRAELKARLTNPPRQKP